jgi:hypothetical protein
VLPESQAGFKLASSWLQAGFTPSSQQPTKAGFKPAVKLACSNGMRTNSDPNFGKVRK